MQVQQNTTEWIAQNGMKPYRHIGDAFIRIIREEGFLALYKGVVPALFLTTHGAVKVRTSSL